MSTFLGLYDFSCNIDRCEAALLVTRGADAERVAARFTPERDAVGRAADERSGNMKGLARKGEMD